MLTLPDREQWANFSSDVWSGKKSAFVEWHQKHNKLVGNLLKDNIL